MSSRRRFDCLDCGLHAISHPNMGCEGRYVDDPDERERVKETKVHLADWLVANGFAEAQRGYGHATGEDIAEAMMEVFDIKFKD